jgi:nitroreductase
VIEMDIFEAIESRHSVRDFLERKMPERIKDDIENLLVKFITKKLDWKINLSSFPSYIYAKAEKHFDELVEYGFQGEQIVLFLTAQGFGTCWMARSPHPDVPYIIVFGYPRTRNFTRKRRPITSFLENDLEELPPEIVKIVEMTILAPSALNRQPWKIKYTGGELCISSERPVDLGIALSHAYLTAREIFKREPVIQKREEDTYCLILNP